MKRLAIMFDDLTEVAQKKLLDFENVNTKWEANWDTIPLVILEREEDE